MSNTEIKEIRQPSMLVNTVSNWAALIVNMGIGFFLTPFLVHYTGKSGYGIWTLVWTFVGYYGLLNMGINLATIRYIAKYIGQKDYKSVNSIVSTSLAVFIVTGICIAIFSNFFADSIVSFFNPAENEYSDFVNVVCILGILAGISFPAMIYSSILSASERFVFTNIIQIFSEIIRVSLVYYSLVNGYGLTGVAYASLVATILKFISQYFYAKIKFPQIKVKFENISLKTLKLLFSFGIFVWITAISNTLSAQIDSSIIGKAINLESVGVYSIGLSLIIYYYRVCKSLSSILTPRLSRIAGKGSRAEFLSCFFSYANFLGLLGFCIGLLMVLLGKDFIYLWVGDQFHESFIVLLILSIGAIPDFATNVSYSALLAEAKHQKYSLYTIIEGLSNLILSLILVNYWGILGVALGTTIPRFIIKFVIITITTSKKLNISFWKYQSVCILRPFSIFIIIGAAYFFLDHYFPLDVSLKWLFVKAALLLTSYAILSYFWGLTKENKGFVLWKLSTFGIWRRILNHQSA